MRKLYPLFSITGGLLLIALFLIALQVQAQETTGHENPSLTHGEGAKTVYVGVQLEQGDNMIREVSYEGTISGLDALTMTELVVEAEDFGWGIAVCSINGVGCPVGDCFCGGDYFWNYTQWKDETWTDPGMGASQTEISTTGQVEGWRWGKWDEGGLPPATSLIPASDGLNWLALQQNAINGGYGYTTEGSMSSSVETLQTIGANDHRAVEWRRFEYSTPLQQYVWGRSSAYAKKAAESGKLASGLVAADSLCYPPLTAKPMDYYDPDTGIYSEHSGFQAWAMLGTLALSDTVQVSAVDYLKSLVMPDGGWEWNTINPPLGSDTNTTALVIQALIAAGEPPTSTIIINGLDYLKAAQNDDGGFVNSADPDSPFYSEFSDTNSTAYAVQAIFAAGQDPITGTWVISNTNAIKYILGMQLENGSFEWMKDDGANLLASQQAIPALLAESLPYKVAAFDNCPVQFLPILHGPAAK